MENQTICITTYVMATLACLQAFGLAVIHGVRIPYAVLVWWYIDGLREAVYFNVAYVVLNITLFCAALGHSVRAGINVCRLAPVEASSAASGQVQPSEEVVVISDHRFDPSAPPANGKF